MQQYSNLSTIQFDLIKQFISFDSVFHKKNLIFKSDHRSKQIDME